ncbi:ATP-binding protein, partial [Dactylosporangium sp. NPDC000555]|uniref:ATP-binding protein n=1 Tax=Dactylosporangium sp. NPDC000555 TaxID=3154260 RepID=UPI003330FD45
EEPLAAYIAAGLRKHGCAVDVAHDGRQALDRCDIAPYDVVVLDRDLPTANGTRGAGLGLSIVRAVVTAHDGEISATAQPTGGMDIAVHLQAPASG